MKRFKTLMAVVTACALQVVSLPTYGEVSADTGLRGQISSGIVCATPAPAAKSADRAESEPLPLAELTEPNPNMTNRFIVKYSGSAPISADAPTASCLSSVGNVRSVRGIGLEVSDVSESVPSAVNTGFQLIELSEATDIGDFSAALESEPGIEYIQPDYRLDLSSLDEDASNDMPTDSENNTSNITDKDNVSADEESTLFPADLPNGDFGSDGAAPTVAVIDTGIDIEHTALNGHIYRNDADMGNDEDENGYKGDVNGWDFHNNASEVYNESLGLDQAHGTHIAGVIAKTAPSAKILPLKVFENGTAYTSDIIEAIQYADAVGAAIANCSWGCTEENIALKEAMESSDMIFVCAAGNNRMDLNETPIYPACYDSDNVISVTSVNDDGGLSYFSNYGDADIAARGRSIESCFPENETGKLTGTSVSAAFVSGALASVYTNAEDTIGRLYNTSDKLLNLQGYVRGGRRLNLEALTSNTPSGEVIDVNPEEDFNTEGYLRTPEQSWELFSALENVSVSTGAASIAVLKADGSVWTWGRNDYGQLGSGNYTNTTVPQQVSSISDVAEVSAGSDHMLVRKSDNTVYGWGRNYNGCLGNGGSGTSTVPVKMLNADNAVSVCAGMCVSYVIKDNYELYSCGSNEYGQMGDGTTTPKSTLTKVNISEKVIAVDGIMAGAAAVTESGKVYTWGANNHYRLGIESTDNQSEPQMVLDANIKSVSVGFFSMMAVDENGQLYTWGHDASHTPQAMSGYTGYDKAVSARQTRFILKDNKIKSCGCNDYGVLGVGDTGWRSAYTDVSGEFVDFDVAEYWAVAIGVNGCIYTWGMLDSDTEEYITAPTKISGEINDFSGDSFDDAAEADEGETRGEITSDYRNDYYKFTPTSTGAYSVYSISEIDLVCKIYTKSSDGTYTLKYSNDDSSLMSGNSYDFFLLKSFTGGTDYYIYVYPYGSSAVGEYTLHIERQSQPSYSSVFNISSGESYVFAVNAVDIASIADAVFTVTFDSSKLTLTDACAQTWDKETTTGAVSGTDIQITSVSSAQVMFRVNKTQSSVTGTVNLIRFTAKSSGTAVVAVTLAQ